MQLNLGGKQRQNSLFHTVYMVKDEMNQQGEGRGKERYRYPEEAVSRNKNRSHESR